MRLLRVAVLPWFYLGTIVYGLVVPTNPNQLRALLGVTMIVWTGLAALLVGTFVPLAVLHALLEPVRVMPLAAVWVGLLVYALAMTTLLILWLIANRSAIRGAKA